MERQIIAEGIAPQDDRSPALALAGLIGIALPPEAVDGVDAALEALRDHLALVRAALTQDSAE